MSLPADLCCPVLLTLLCRIAIQSNGAMEKEAEKSFRLVPLDPL